MRLKPLTILLSTAAAVVLLDQLQQGRRPRVRSRSTSRVWLVPGLLRSTTSRTSGAAFSLLQGQRWFFIVVAVLVLGVVDVGVVALPAHRRPGSSSRWVSRWAGPSAT